MRFTRFYKYKFYGFFFALFLISPNTKGQEINSNNPKSDFWENVQFGGGLGLNFGGNYTDITVAPSAIYNFNQYISAGVGLQYSYFSSKNFFSSHNYGASLLVLGNPIPEIQLSAELEQLRVNLSYDNTGITDNFWNSALFVGAGYRMENITIGVRYNVLYNENKNVYSEAFMPFVRVYF
jgi:long-subunit fatty acid transport protein